MRMFLPYFEEEVYDQLVNNIEHNKDRYYSDEKWLEDYFVNEKYISESAIDVPEITLEFSKKTLKDSEKNEQDYRNAVSIYASYKDIITPQIATNKYMWTALSHTVFSEYVKYRWWQHDIKERFFCTGGRQSLVYYNAISRLWWAAHLTYSEQDKYELTQVLFDSGQQTFKDLTDCAYSMNRTITRGVLKAIRELKQEPGIVKFGECFRDLNKFLNRQGVVISLDFLSEDEIKDIAVNYMKKWQVKRNEI